ncbi:MAG: 8-amino-7-oxononanoate synthase [Burkholderiales bacterium]|nr:8-amino-7-oxononanoate synthase [Burkholderiales bacterium]
MFGFDSRLEELAGQQQLRRRRVVQGAQGANLNVAGNSYLSFCSNDYLGLANHPALIEAVQHSAAAYGVGAAASHLVCGHSEPHEALEDALARFVKLPRALYFSTGYMAALGVIPALVGRGDSVFSDALNHACLIDGIRLSGAAVHRYPHCDLATLEDALARCASPRKLVVSDAVFSMDGDVAPVPELLALCDRYDALLMLDDAHGFGVLGADGRGVLSHFNVVSARIVYMGTLGKAAGVFGAFIAGERTIIEWLLQRARTYIYTTASPPLLAAAAQESLRLIEAAGWRRAKLRQLILQLRAGLADLPLNLLPSNTPIQPFIVGANDAAMQLSEALLKQAIWVPAIRPPSVPQGSARLRISLSAAHDPADIARLVQTIRQIID